MRDMVKVPSECFKDMKITISAEGKEVVATANTQSTNTTLAATTNLARLRVNRRRGQSHLNREISKQVRDEGQKTMKQTNRLGNVVEARFGFDTLWISYGSNPTTAGDFAKLAVSPLGVATHHAHLADSPLSIATYHGNLEESALDIATYHGHLVESTFDAATYHEVISRSHLLVPQHILPISRSPPFARRHIMAFSRKHHHPLRNLGLMLREIA